MHHTNKAKLIILPIIAASAAIAMSYNTLNHSSNADAAQNHSQLTSIDDNKRLTPHTASRMIYHAPVKAQSSSETNTQSAASTSSTTTPIVDTPSATQASTTQSASTDTTKSSAQAASTVTPSQTTTSAVTSTPAPRTDGFNLNGVHYDMANYADTSGAEVPQWTPYVYRYVVLPNYYLAEGQSNAGLTARNAGIGSTLVLNGKTLHMTGIMSVNRNDPNAFEQMRAVGSQNQAVLQTCYDATGVNLKVELFN